MDPVYHRAAAEGCDKSASTFLNKDIAISLSSAGHIMLVLLLEHAWKVLNVLGEGY